MRPLVALVLLTIGAGAAAQRPDIAWASFAVERTAYEADEKTGRYASTGSFDGVGMLYFSPAKQKLEYKGFRAIRIPYPGQERDDKFEVRVESFATTSVINLGGGEFAFKAIAEGPFARAVTGRIRIKIAPSAIAATVTEFRMEEHGDMYDGVMTRYTLPMTTAGRAMLSKLDEIFFGGNFVALIPPS